MSESIWGSADQMTAREVLALFEDSLPENIETMSSLEVCKAIVQYLYDHGYRRIDIAQGGEFSRSPLAYFDCVMFQNNNIFYVFVPPGLEAQPEGLFLKNRNLQQIRSELSKKITRDGRPSSWGISGPYIAEIEGGALNYPRGGPADGGKSLEYYNNNTLVLDPTENSWQKRYQKIFAKVVTGIRKII